MIITYCAILLNNLEMERDSTCETEYEPQVPIAQGKYMLQGIIRLFISLGAILLSAPVVMKE